MIELARRRMMMGNEYQPWMKDLSVSYNIPIENIAAAYREWHGIKDLFVPDKNGHRLYGSPLRAGGMTFINTRIPTNRTKVYFDSVFYDNNVGMTQYITFDSGSDIFRLYAYRGDYVLTWTGNIYTRTPGVKHVTINNAKVYVKNDIGTILGTGTIRNADGSNYVLRIAYSPESIENDATLYMRYACAKDTDNASSYQFYVPTRINNNDGLLDLISYTFYPRGIKWIRV